MITQEKLSTILEEIKAVAGQNNEMSKSDKMLYDAIKKITMEERYNDASVLLATVYSPFLRQQIINDLLVDFCREGNLAAFNFIIEMGAQVDFNNGLPLVTACKHGSLNLVLALLEIGLKPNCDAICQAALNCQKEIIQELIKVEMNINIDNGLPLRLCAEYGLADMVDFLIQSGADVHVLRDRALIVATNNGHVDTVRVLLHHDADPDTWNGYCFKIARDKKFNQILDLLSAHKEEIAEQNRLNLINDN